jgi:DNA repair protein RadC
MQDSGKPQFSAAPDYLGHHARLKERFDTSGFTGFADHETLEILLFFVYQRRDTKPIAKALLKAFGSLENVFAAKREHLVEIRGVGPAGARLIHLVRALYERVMKARVHGSAPIISSISDLMKYLGATMANLGEEQFRVIFVDHANTILQDEVLSQGVEDQTAVYPKQVMRRALALHATGILVVHNHPSGLVNPSQADRDITRALKNAAQTLEIRLLDHLIIGREGKGYFSFRENGLLV